VLSRSIHNQLSGIHDDETEKIANPKILQSGKRLEQGDNVNLVIVSCATDPGVKGLEEKVRKYNKEYKLKYKIMSL